MTWDEFEAWAPHSVRGAAAQQVASGFHPEADALTTARQQLDEQLPDGIASHLQLLHTVRAGAPGGPLVGYLWLRIRPRGDEVEAYVMDVEVLPRARGRGLGRATMLAAERLARDLGATVLALTVHAHNTAARGLYTSLGLTVTGSTMVVRPASAAARAPGREVDLRAVTGPELDAFLSRRTRARADDLVRSEGLSDRESRRRAEAELRRMLPQGPATPGQLLRTAYDGDAALGLVWLGLQHRSDGTHAVGRELWVPPGPLRATHGRAVLHAALAACRELGARTLEVTVPDADGVSSVEVYERCGFDLTAQTMATSLSTPPERR
jgi:GNAT superfamily N-acetyltransferase